MTTEEAILFLQELDARRAEYAVLKVIDDRVIRSQDRQRLDWLSFQLAQMNRRVEPVLRELVAVPQEAA